MMTRTVAIDCFPESVEQYRNGHAIVAVDVIRATTTAVTAVAAGRRCYPVPTIEAAAIFAARIPNALLVGELGGNTPYGFDLTNSPAELAVRSDLERPMILLSTSGTRVVCAAGETQPTFVACLRNYSAQAAYLAAHHDTVALIGAGARGDFREEDALCCAWIAEQLLNAGYEPADRTTLTHVERWRGADVEVITRGKSAAYLRDTNQTADLDFIVAHIDDLNDAYTFRRGEVVRTEVGVSESGPVAGDRVV